MAGFHWAASAAQERQAEILGKLTLLARGDHRLVRRAVLECAHGGSAALSEVMAYIMRGRHGISPPPVPRSLD